ncbi:hypothetical protein CARUB_v10018627mg, partial [Capsella rubella]
MAKNINSVSFTVLLIVFFMATTEIIKSNAEPRCFTFLDECGPDPFLDTNLDCTACCRSTYPGQKVCKGVVEGSEQHCHCYQRSKKDFFCFQIKQQGKSLSLLLPLTAKLML